MWSIGKNGGLLSPLATFYGNNRMGKKIQKKKKTVSYNKVSLSPFNESVTFHAHTSQCIHPASQRGLYRRGQLVMHNLNNTNTVLWLMWQ